MQNYNSKFKIIKKLKKELPGLRKCVPLAQYTTFKIGGPAKYFFLAKTKKNLIKAIMVAKKLGLPFFILGRGSNVLVSDKGFKGLVIKIENCKLKIENCKITVGAGFPLERLAIVSAEKGLAGLEWAAGIPGTVGGAIYGNAGAFSGYMANITKAVEVLEIPSSQVQNSKFKRQNDNAKFKIKEYKNKDCKFNYRDSIFKQNKNLIILSAEFQLRKGIKKEIQEKIKEYLNYRRKNHPLNFPSAGSVFKNLQGISAAQLIEQCGLKGKRIGNAKISEKHANFIINLGRSKAKDVRKLINLIKRKVKNKFNIELKEEIQYLGF